MSSVTSASTVGARTPSTTVPPHTSVAPDGAKQIFAAATHGLLVGPAIERLQAAPLSGIIVTDSIPLAQEKTLQNITVLSVASLLGQAIKRIHRNESVSMMFQ